MKLARHRHQTRLGINMTPMIDIVFLLIIFFMTVSQITQALDHPVNLPDVQQGGENLDRISITFNLDAAGTLFIAGKPYSLDQAMLATRRELERVGGRAENLKILLRGDHRCPSRFVNNLVERLNALGITQIRLSVQSQQSE